VVTFDAEHILHFRILREQPGLDLCGGVVPGIDAGELNSAIFFSFRTLRLVELTERLAEAAGKGGNMERVVGNILIELKKEREKVFLK
jgi:hypothetical protein